MTKILFFDIDGTLVSFRTHRIPGSTLDAIRRVRERGVKVWIATGRPLPFIDNLEGLEYDGIMCVSGAYCVLNDGTVLRSTPVEREDVRHMVEDQHRTGMGVAYAGIDRAIITGVKGITEEAHETFRMLAIPEPEFCPPEEALTFDVMQIIAFFPPKETERIMTDVLPHCDEARWHPYFTDCVMKGTNKASGMDAVIRHYGFDLSETMAFGDGGNDIAMLRHAGIGIAMGNANPEVQAAADFVTSSVDEDGIAKVLLTL